MHGDPLDPLSLSVSELRCAVVDPEWRERWKRGEKPTVRSFAPAGTPTVHGTRFHAFARQLVDHLLEDAPAARELDADGMFRIAYSQGAGEFIGMLLTEGNLESAGVLTEALHTFTRRLVQLREQHPRFKSWRDVFVGAELSVNNVRLENVGDRLIFVSGAMDSVRRRPDGMLEIVDYKLTRGAALEREIVQVALYARLLQSRDPSLPLCGALEYYHPTFHCTPIEAKSLAAVYMGLVLPALRDLSRSPASNVTLLKGPGPADMERRTGPDGDAKHEVTASGPATAQAPPRAPPRPPSYAARSNARKEVLLGHLRSAKADPIFLELDELTRHAGILGGNGSGKTTLALNIIERVLDAQIPVLVVDRKGDLSGYAGSSSESDAHTERTDRLNALCARLDVALFTPGSSKGRPLSIGILPPLTAELDEAEREQVCGVAALSLGSILNYKQGAADQKVAILKEALGTMALRSGGQRATLAELIHLLTEQDPALLERIGTFNPKHVKQLCENLQTLEIMQGDILQSGGEALSAELLFGLGEHARPGATRLSIVSTKFLPDEKTALFWVAQLLTELSRFASRRPSSTLQALVFLDEADLYLPAISKPVTKQPMESLLKRARSAGISVMLATQSPGDLDYKCRDNVRNWFMGLIKERTALEKLKPLTSEANFDATTLLPKQKVGQFFMVTEKACVSFMAEPSLLETRQLPEQWILDHARASKR
jgi:Helicase HerA, central domain/PD-(D/E)XK nuclease superfamily